LGTLFSHGRSTIAAYGLTTWFAKGECLPGSHSASASADALFGTPSAYSYNTTASSARTNLPPNLTCLHDSQTARGSPYARVYSTIFSWAQTIRASNVQGQPRNRNPLRGRGGSRCPVFCSNSPSSDRTTPLHLKHQPRNRKAYLYGTQSAHAHSTSVFSLRTMTLPNYSLQPRNRSCVSHRSVQHTR
jgi:hypothetical protein